MSRMVLATCAALLAACLCGCGGSSGGSGGLETDVYIQPNGVSPMNVTVHLGDRVTWLNNLSTAQTISSGALAMIDPGHQTVAGRIFIETNNSFVPSFLEGDFGNRVEWQNNRSGTFTMDLVDQAGNVVRTFTFAVGQVITFSGFPKAGTYTYRQHDNPLISGQLRLFGTPVPDGQFVNTLAPTGGSFARPFGILGTYNYYVFETSSPGTAFINGTIVVQ